MKKRFLALILGLVLIPAVAFASPFVRCDQYTAAMGDPDYFKISIDSGAYIQIPTYVYQGETGDSMHYDLATIAVGQHTIKAQACKAANPPWQPTEVCSVDSDPFLFTKPAPVTAPGKPVSLGLSAQ